MAVFVFEVVPAVIRAKDPVVDLKVRGEGFSTGQPRTLRFVSPDGAVVVPASGFTIDSDSVLTVASITFPVIGTYRIQVENQSGLLATVDGAVIVNRPPIDFTLSPAEIVVNEVVEGAKLTLVGVAASQVGMVRFSGPGLFEIDEFGRPDPKTIAFFPLAFGFLGDYDIQLFTDNTGATPIGSIQVAGLSVIRSPKVPEITGLSLKLLQPGETGTGIIVQGSGFIDALIEIVRVQSATEAFVFSPQPAPFIPEEDVPPGRFRLLGDGSIMLGPLTPTQPGDFGVFLETSDGGTPVFVASRIRALTVQDTRKPAVVFSPPPQGSDDPITVSLQAQFTDAITGLATGTVDPTAVIYVLKTPLDLRPALGALDPNSKPWETINAGDTFNIPGSAGYGGDGGPAYPGRPIVTASMRYTGPFEVSRPTLVQAIAVDQYGNVSDVVQGVYDISNQADRTLLTFENPVDSYSRFANVNAVVRALRIKYTAILGEEDVPGVVQQAAGATAAKTTLLRDLRRGLVDLLHSAGKSLREVLPFPTVEYLSDLQLKLTPGREIFAASPFPYAPGDNTWRVTRRTLEFGFATTPANGNYEVLLIPSYAGHSFLDPFIRVAGSSTMPPPLPSATLVPKPVTIFTKIATFTVTSGKIVKSSIVNITAGRTVSPRFTDQDLERDNVRIPRDIHYRELEIALEYTTLPPGVSVATGDGGTRVNDPKTLPSIADQPGRAQEYFPPSNVADEFSPDDMDTFVESVGDMPRGPATTNLTYTIRVITKGTNVRDEKWPFSFGFGIGRLKFRAPVLFEWTFGDLDDTDITISSPTGKSGLIAELATRDYIQNQNTPFTAINSGDSLKKHGISIPATPLSLRRPSPITKTPTDYPIDYRTARKIMTVTASYDPGGGYRSVEFGPLSGGESPRASYNTPAEETPDSVKATLNNPPLYNYQPNGGFAHYSSLYAAFYGSNYDIRGQFPPNYQYCPTGVTLLVDGTITAHEEQDGSYQTPVSMTYPDTDEGTSPVAYGPNPAETVTAAQVGSGPGYAEWWISFPQDAFPINGPIGGGDILELKKPADPNFGVRQWSIAGFIPASPAGAGQAGYITLSMRVPFTQLGAPLDTSGTVQLTTGVYTDIKIMRRSEGAIFDVPVPSFSKNTTHALDIGKSSNEDIGFQMYNYRTKAWLTEDESQQDWPSTDVRSSGGVRIRMVLKGGLVRGDVENVDFQIYLNGQQAYGPL